MTSFRFGSQHLQLHAHCGSLEAKTQAGGAGEPWRLLSPLHQKQVGRATRPPGLSEDPVWALEVEVGGEKPPEALVSFIP